MGETFTRIADWGVVMPMAMTVPRSPAQFPSRRNRDPAAEGNQSHAGGCVDEVTEAGGDGDASESDDRRNNERRNHMADSCVEDASAAGSWRE